MRFKGSKVCKMMNSIIFSYCNPLPALNPMPIPKMVLGQNNHNMPRGQEATGSYINSILFWLLQLFSIEYSLWQWSSLLYSHWNACMRFLTKFGIGDAQASASMTGQAQAGRLCCTLTLSKKLNWIKYTNINNFITFWRLGAWAHEEKYRSHAWQSPQLCVPHFNRRLGLLLSYTPCFYL